MEVNNSLPIGTILKGFSYSYRIEGILGQGSFGITYLASVKMTGVLGSIDANIKVAIKEFFMRNINGRSDATVTCGSKGGIYENYKRKFTKEAVNLSKLKHINIIKVIESFEANNTVYYVMEYIAGGNLDDYIIKNNGLNEKEAIEIVKQIGSALSFMHKNKMLHLDLKPSNIMRKESGDVVLIDFGLSKQYDLNGEPESSTKVGAGTPGYAPIEQANYCDGKGFPVTMDVYALGATMFKMLTGVRPPEASDILNYGFPLYELQERGISERLSVSIAKAMAPTKKDRFDSVSGFIDSFEEEVTVIDVDVAVDRNSQNEYKTEVFFQVRPNTGKVTFEFYPRTPFSDGAFFCSVDKMNGVDTNITKENTHVGRKLNEQEYKLFLSDLQSLNLKVRDKEVPPYRPLEYSENPAVLRITLYDDNYQVYNKLWISGWKNELGNIEGDVYVIEEQVRKIVPMLQEYIDGPYYEYPNLFQHKKKSLESKDEINSERIGKIKESETQDIVSNLYNVISSTKKVEIAFVPSVPNYGMYNACIKKNEVQIRCGARKSSWALSRKAFNKFLDSLKALNLNVRDNENLESLEASESVPQLTISLYDANNSVYTKFWIGGWNNQFGNIIGDTLTINEKIKKLIPHLNEFLNSSNYIESTNNKAKVVREESNKKILQINPSTSKVRIEYWPYSLFPPRYNGAFITIISPYEVNPNITQESTREMIPMTRDKYKIFLNDLQNLKLELREKAVEEIEPKSFFPAKLKISLYDKDGVIYNDIMLDGMGGGNIVGNIDAIEKQIIMIVPGLSKYLNGPFYEVPDLMKEKDNDRIPSKSIFHIHEYIISGKFKKSLFYIFFIFSFFVVIIILGLIYTIIG